MRTILLTGSSTILSKEPRRIPPYMAAIIRRHRIVIILSICLLMLILLSWHFQKKDNFKLQSTTISYVNKNSNKERNYMKQIEEKYVFLNGNEKATTTSIILNHEKEYSSQPKVGVITVTNYLNLKESSHDSNPFSLSAIQQPDDNFPAPYHDNDRQITEGVTFPFISNVTEATGLVKLNKNSFFNQQGPILIQSNATNSDKNFVHLIDTPGCKIPRLDPYDPTVKHIVERLPPYICIYGDQEFMNSHAGGFITLNKTILWTHYNMTPDELICSYQPIYRVHENEWSIREDSTTAGRMMWLEFGKPLNEDYVAVYCNMSGNTYEQYFPLVRLKENVEKERNSIPPPYPPLNVILIGVDSVSKLNFLRHFSKTHAFLKEKLKPFEMNGYTKVGDNTFPNLVPLLTGQFVEHWWNETVKDTMFFDDVGFIWKEYAKRGYRTFYAEDFPSAGTFNYEKRGFYDPPTDYYFRPLGLALDQWKKRTDPDMEFCLNSQIEFDIIFDYLQEFSQTMGSRPYFGFSMVSTITHDFLNYAQWADEPVERVLDGLLNMGALNNTLLALFSDHGLRYGNILRTYVGKFEERLPLMYIHVPKWFLDDNPEIYRNLQINQDRLITLFDIHATMLHLLDLNKDQEQTTTSTLGKSLFEEILPNRTCADANIQEHFCPCQTFDIVDLNNPAVQNASQSMVNDINFKLQPYSDVCEILEVDTIIDARVGKVNEIMLTNPGAINNTLDYGYTVTSLDDYMITLDSKPGGAVFEGTVRHNTDNNNYSVLGLSRISMYGNTSWCINSQKMKLFCYCKIQQMS